MKPKLKHFLHPFKTASKLKWYLLSKPYRREWLVKLFSTFSTYKEPEKWVFIVGCYNSGTTLLERILSTHPDISALDEGVFFTDELITPEELGWTRMWCRVADKVRLTEEDDSVDADKVKRDWGMFFDSSKPIYLEKSIVNSARMRWLQANFKNSYFIAIIRNGYAVAEGIRRKSPRGRWGIQQEQFNSPRTPYSVPCTTSNGSYPIELCAQQWVENNKIIEEDSEYIDRFMKIQYEDLCDDPKGTITEIYEFLNIDSEFAWDNETEWQIQEKKAKIKNMNQRSFERLSQEEVEDIKESVLGMYRYNE